MIVWNTVAFYSRIPHVSSYQPRCPNVFGKSNGGFWKWLKTKVQKFESSIFCFPLFHSKSISHNFKYFFWKYLVWLSYTIKNEFLEWTAVFLIKWSGWTIKFRRIRKQSNGGIELFPTIRFVREIYLLAVSRTATKKTRDQVFCYLKRPCDE